MRRKRKETTIMVAAEKKETQYTTDPETGKRIRLKQDGTPWAAPVRRPENKFISWATGMLTNFYHISPDNIKVRRSPFGKQRTIYLLVDGQEKAVRSERELHDVVKELEATRQ